MADGDIIISMSNSAELVGKVAKAKSQHVGYAYGAFLSTIRSPIFDPDFLYYLLRSEAVQLELRQSSSQTVNIANISLSGMSSIRLPLPPLAEQRRIASKLAAVLAQTKKAREELTRIPRLAERCKQAILSRLMSVDEHGRPWPLVRLEELITDGPTNGYSPRAGENPNGTLSLKLTATTRGTLDLSARAVKRLNEVIKNDSKFWLREGDILIQRSNSREYVGTAAIYAGPERTYIYPDLMIRIRVAKGCVRADWEHRDREEVCLFLDPTKRSDPKMLTFDEKGIPLPSDPKNPIVVQKVTATVHHLFLDSPRLIAARNKAWRETQKWVDEYRLVCPTDINSCTLQDYERFGRHLDQLGELTGPDKPYSATARACLRANGLSEFIQAPEEALAA